MSLIPNVILVNYIHYSSKTPKCYNKLYKIRLRDNTDVYERERMIDLLVNMMELLNMMYQQ